MSTGNHQHRPRNWAQIPAHIYAMARMIFAGLDSRLFENERRYNDVRVNNGVEYIFHCAPSESRRLSLQVTCPGFLLRQPLLSSQGKRPEASLLICSLVDALISNGMRLSRTTVFMNTVIAAVLVKPKSSQDAIEIFLESIINAH